MTTITKTKTWITRTGKLATVTGKLILERNVWLDGHEDTVPCCKITINLHIEGHGDQGGHMRPLKASEKALAPDASYTHRCGDAALTTEQVEIINSIRRELESHPAWQTKQAAIKAAEEAEAEERRHRNAHPGWCNKCHSYCWGDCEAN